MYSEKRVAGAFGAETRQEEENGEALAGSATAHGQRRSLGAQECRPKSDRHQVDFRLGFTAPEPISYRKSQFIISKGTPAARSV
jgi:hypothetical protein